MHEFVRNLITEWRRLELPAKDETLIVAVSGGADSLSLLLALADLKKRGKLDHRIVAAHFDHKLRPDSAADLERVRQVAAEHGVELVHDAAGSIKGNVEAAAREARYEFLLRAAERLGASLVLTAHTMNDQAETVLMNLVRGSGIDGLGGIRPIRQLIFETKEASGYLPNMEPGVRVVRPLLRWATRKATEGFCGAANSAFCRDPMNDDMNLRRVWIRKALIPMLADYNPRIVETLSTTAELLQHAAAKIEENGEAGSDSEVLPIADLKTLEEPELFARIRAWIGARRGTLRGISQKHVAAVANLVTTTKSGRVAELPGGAVKKGGGRLSWEFKKGEKG